MNNLEENLRKIKTRGLSAEEKDSLWHNVVVRRVDEERGRRDLSFSVFNFSMKKIVIGALVLLLVFGGGGVVAASNSSMPGDFLFPIDLAIEKLQINFSGKDKQEELRLRFAEERVDEIKQVSKKKVATPASLVADLSDAKTLEIEADVFTNETVVKIEADDRNYGYLSEKKNKDDLAKEISEKYSISLEKVSTLIDFEIENRDSRADDKGFLNKTNSVVFSDKESRDVSRALNEIENFLKDREDDENEDTEEIRESLKEILILLGDDGKIEIRRDDGRIKIETKNGEVKVDVKVKNEDSGKSSDDDDKDDDSRDRGAREDDSDDDKEEDVKEDDDEVFCRGEWRDPEDCIDDDDDNNNDEKDDDENDDDDEKDDGEDDDGDDDNSGSGSDEDKDDDN